MVILSLREKICCKSSETDTGEHKAVKLSKHATCFSLFLSLVWASSRGCVTKLCLIPIPAGIDYGQFPDSGVGFIHVILMDESQVDAGIVILDDNIVEYNENFTVRYERPIPCDLCQGFYSVQYWFRTLNFQIWKDKFSVSTLVACQPITQQNKSIPLLCCVCIALLACI